MGPAGLLMNLDGALIVRRGLFDIAKGFVTAGKPVTALHRRHLTERVRHLDLFDDPAMGGGRIKPAVAAQLKIQGLREEQTSLGLVGRLGPGCQQIVEPPYGCVETLTSQVGGGKGSLGLDCWCRLRIDEKVGRQRKQTEGGQQDGHLPEVGHA